MPDQDQRRIPIEKGRRRLAWVWMVGFVIILATLLVQLIGGAWGYHFFDATEWVVPHLGPTSGLVIATFARNATTRPTGAQLTVDRFFLNLTIGIAIIHLLLVWIFLVAGALFAHFTAAGNGVEARLELLDLGNALLGLVQTALATSFGVFFISESKS